MSGNKRPSISGDWEKIYQLHRGRIGQEENLIHYRTLWLLGAQAILFGLWGGLLDEKRQIDPFTLKFLKYSLTVAGLLTAIGSLYWINAARQEIEYIKTLYIKTRHSFPDLTSPEEDIFRHVVGAQKRHFWGLIGAMFLPIFLLRCGSHYS
jgi:hypothetical protein